ncbi:hypothetical protein GJ496_004353 [Pomphorhynchus laevis]|nr:hypothetical protein GJ496_004353 [Pomphorhynchus laevis]
MKQNITDDDESSIKLHRSNVIKYIVLSVISTLTVLLIISAFLTRFRRPKTVKETNNNYKYEALNQNSREDDPHHSGGRMSLQTAVLSNDLTSGNVILIGQDKIILTPGDCKILNKMSVAERFEYIYDLMVDISDAKEYN